MSYLEESISTIKKTLHGTGLVEVNDPFIDIKKKFEAVRDNGSYIILENSSFPHTETNIIYITEVYDTWALGYSMSRFESEFIRVPKTIHYSDVYVKIDNKVKVIFEGENPYE